jgi:flagellar biosynthesis protein FlhF
MQVKSFTGTSAPEVLAQVKAELGPDAIILGNRNFRKGGILRHEVTAGIERRGNGEDAALRDSAPPGWSEWHKDWMIIKDQIHALMKPALRMDRLSPRQRQVLEYLQREGVNDDVIFELYRRIVARPNVSLLEPLDAMTPVRPWSRALWKERLHILAGPFGGGKTVSALRMALLLRQEEPELNIAFINVDCARGTGRLVLRHWAELSNFAYHEAPKPDARRRALSACAGADYIFVDMPGFGRTELLSRHIEELGLDATDAATHIVLAPHYDPAQTAAFLARCRGTERSSLIWTKLDEAVAYGAVLNIGHMSGLPVSALSYGPGLRGSMIPADPVLLRRLIFKRRLPGESPDAPIPRATE